MEKSNKEHNALIKRRNLLSLLKKNGILRINKEALNSLEKHIYKYLVKNIPKLKENMEINGRKTLKGEDVFILDEQKRENYPEI